MVLTCVNFMAQVKLCELGGQLGQPIPNQDSESCKV